MEEGEKLNFSNEITEILTTQNCYPSECEMPEVLVLRETNCGNQVAEILGKGGKRKYELWQPSCRNLGEEFKKKKIRQLCAKVVAQKCILLIIIFLYYLTFKALE